MEGLGGGTIEFGVLGPLMAVPVDGAPLDLGTPKARSVLAVLLCRPGRVVSVDTIVDALWPLAPPAAAVKNVQLYVHQLRRALGDPARISHRDGGYLLAAAPEEVDALRFASLVERHRAAAAEDDKERARALLVEALGLWRGEHAYAGVGDVPPVAAEARRLGEARLAALGSRIDLDLRLGRHGELVPELTALTMQHPLDERFWAQLITALLRSGRPAAALAAYDGARRVIVEETGLDPGPRLRDLQRAILTGDGSAWGAGREPAQAAPPTALPRMLPPDVGDFTGRRVELATITAALSAGPQVSSAVGARGVVPVAALSGQGGVGKTALAVHAAHRLVGAYPDGQLFAALAGAQPVPADPGEVLAGFLRALGVGGRSVPETREERAAMFRSLVAERRMLVLLDDASDEAQVRPLLPGTANCAVLVTSRARLGGLGGARHVDLVPMLARDGYRLLERIAGPSRASAEPDSARDLVALCAGLPLALRIAGSRLASRPHWSIGDLVGQIADERSRLDALRHRDLEVRASFALSYHALGSDAQRLFRLLGLLEAPDVTCLTAAALLDCSPAEAEELLEVLTDARLIEVSGPDEAGQRRYRFHDLVRLYAKELAIAEETDCACAAALGRAFGALLALTDAVHRAKDGGDYTIILGDAPRWRPSVAAAAVTASGPPLAWLRAERLSLVAAVRQAAALLLDEFCWELAVGGVCLYEAGGYDDDWLETHQLALAATEAAGNHRGHAMMLHLLASYYNVRRQPVEVKRYTDGALDEFGKLGESYGYALALRKSAEYERHGGQFARAAALARQAGDLLAAHGDPVAAADSLIIMGIALFEHGDLAGSAAVLGQVVAEARNNGSRVIAAHGSYWLALGQLALGRRDEAAATVAELSELIRTLEDQIGEVYACHARGAVARAGEDLAAARAEFLAGLTAAGEMRDRLMQVRILTGLGELSQTEGKHDEAARLLTEAVTISEDIDMPFARTQALLRLGDAHAAMGDVAGARAAREEASAIAARIEAAATAGSGTGPEPPGDANLATRS
jgi:DNA-binding SARP family transcriptional activator/tetratricopeptide (TPR) repeat protein